MEFFERAHVTKRVNAKKETKTEETMKRKLKQMLQGFKKSDNVLIKSSSNTNNDLIDMQEGLDDSTSVSGFSDLNLTNSSFDVEMSQESDDHPSFKEGNVSKSEEINLSNSSDFENLSNDNTDDSIDSISDYNEEQIQQLAIGASDQSVFNESDNISLTSNFGTSTDNEISNTEYSDTEFDADGCLASKIIEKLGINDPSIKHGNSNKNIHSNSKLDAQHSHVLKKSTGNASKKKKKVKAKKEEARLDYKSDEIEESILNDSIHETPSTNPSSPFVSISAQEIPNESLDDVLGNYIHPTVRNLPCDKQNIINSNEFGVSDMCEISDDAQEISSLIPELDDREYIDDSILALSESNDFNNTINSEATSNLEQPRDIEEVNKIENTVQVYFGKHNCVMVLKHPTELYVHGKVKIKSLSGTVEVFGYTLQNTYSDLYAPHYNYAHCLKTIESSNTLYGLFNKLTSLGFSVQDAEEIVTTVNLSDGVISFASLASQKLDFVENNFTSGDLFTKRSDVAGNLKKASEYLGCCLYLSKPKRYLDEKLHWGLAVDCGIAELSKTMITGGKGVGKSTFLRYYVNKLVARGPVLVIDLDPGQAEFTVAGNVSASLITEPLLGPNFTHLRTPDKMLNIGAINIMDNIARYASAIEVLLAYCRAEDRFAAVPWVVNTMGLCNNMGLKLMALIILYLNPTLLVQIDSKNVKKRFSTNLDSHSMRKLYFESYVHTNMFRNVEEPHNLNYSFVMVPHEDKRNGPTNSWMTPKDERYLNFLAYFGELMNLHSGMGLLDIVPYQVPLRALSIGTNVRIPKESVLKVINGKIVALCQQSQDRAVFTLDNKPTLCFGYGLVRSVDYENEILFVVTPTPFERLALVNTLVYADWVPELRGQERHLPPGESVPYRTSAEYQQRQLMFAPRRRFIPLQLLKMSRNA